MKRKQVKKQETAEQTRKRLERNKSARARHWMKTGVREETVQWMDRNGML